MIGIYKFTNKLTGESYIGQSVDVKKRFNQHKSKYDKFGNKEKALEDTYFHSMLRHYGFHNFDFEIVEECTPEKLNEREIYYIAFYNSLYPNGYNKTCGGNNPHTNSFDNIETIYEIQKLLKTTTLSNIELGQVYGVSDQTISDINSGRCWYRKDISYPIRDGRKIANVRSSVNGNTKRSCCKSCGIEISKNSKTGLCIKCYSKEKSKNIPDKDMLYELLLKHSFLAVGRMFNVSDNAVRRWCDKYGIPRNSKYYRSVVC